MRAAAAPAADGWMHTLSERLLHKRIEAVQSPQVLSKCWLCYCVNTSASIYSSEFGRACGRLVPEDVVGFDARSASSVFSDSRFVSASVGAGFEKTNKLPLPVF